MDTWKSRHWDQSNRCKADVSQSSVWKSPGSTRRVLLELEVQWQATSFVTVLETSRGVLALYVTVPCFELCRTSSSTSMGSLRASEASISTRTT